MQAIQATAITQISIEHYVPVMPTEESQADKGIDHPIVFCWDCDTEWRSYEMSRCPGCARHCGEQRELDEEEMWDLMEAVSYLDERKTFDYDKEYDTWEFHLLLEKHAPWYDMNSRISIQACYLALQKRDPHPKVAFAIAFFRAEYDEAMDSEMMYDPNRDPEEVPAHIVAWGEYLDRVKQASSASPL